MHHGCGEKEERGALNEEEKKKKREPVGAIAVEGLVGHGVLHGNGVTGVGRGLVVEDQHESLHVRRGRQGEKGVEEREKEGCNVRLGHEGGRGEKCVQGGGA